MFKMAVYEKVPRTYSARHGNAKTCQHEVHFAQICYSNTFILHVTSGRYKINARGNCKYCGRRLPLERSKQSRTKCSVALSIDMTEK